MHTYRLTCGQCIICFYMIELGADFTMMEVKSSANSPVEGKGVLRVSEERGVGDTTFGTMKILNTRLESDV